MERRERGGEWLKVNNYPTPNTTFTVQDLHEGSKYEFRVIAVNEAGPGKPSKPTEPITAGHQRRKYNRHVTLQHIYNFLKEIVGRKLIDHRVSVRPDAPEPPKPDRITKDSVTLSWRPPRSDGGAKIRGYIIQMKQRAQEEWDDVNGALIPTNVYTVPKLTEGEEYLFRVIAVNDVGNSDPSRPSNPIVIEEQPNKPVMDLGGVRDITVRAGEDFSIHVPYIGFPKPTATWYANDVIKDETEPRVYQQLGDDYARYTYRSSCYKSHLSQLRNQFSSLCSLVVKNAKRSDGGQYRLQLRNSSGFDTATVNVKVLDRPNPPENLHADEFGGDALTLFWNPPKDNGGADITNYVVEKREPKGSWSKVRAL